MGEIARVFLDWQQPLLVSAVDWFARRYAVGGEFDLGRAIAVVPGRRAGRRLLELLVQHSEAHSLRLAPPKIETIGTLPEELYPLQRPLAGDLIQQLVWTKALRELDSATQLRIVPRPPADDDAQGWWSLGRLLCTQHRELAGDGLKFADVAERGGAVPGFDEADRWDALRIAQDSYLQSLDEMGLWDVQTARLVAIRRCEPRTDRDIILIGTVDMNRAARQMLDLVSDRVTALIAAPPEMSNRFDSHGCLNPESWAEALIDVPSESIRVCDGPADQVDQVAAELAAIDRRYRADEIVIGLAETALAPMITRRLASCGVATRWIEAHPVSDTAPCRLLRAVADYLDKKRFDEVAALVRHADVAEWISQRMDTRDGLSALDEAFAEYLPVSPDVLRSLLAASSPVAQLCGAVQELLQPIDEPPRELSQWSEPLLKLLRAVYGDRFRDDSSLSGRSLVESLEKLQEVAQEAAEIPRAIAPVVSATDAMECALLRIADKFVPPDTDANAVELLGWLDLPWDDTPAAIVTSFNEGNVPKSRNSDLFLPNELRRVLGLDDNLRRFARDAYAVSVLRHTRREVAWIVGRRDAEGNPLLPSRLLFATESERLAERVLRLLSSPNSRAQSAAPTEPRGSDLTSLAARLDIPHPARVAELLQRRELLEPVHELTLRVTEFRSYLECPYRYFLRHVLNLVPLADDAVEMDGRLFGNVLHEVLCRFGQSELWRQPDADKLRGGLRQILDEVAKEQFGSRRRAAVEVQLRQILLRLQAFADWQADWRRAGWAIAAVEVSVQPPVEADAAPAFVVDGVPIRLRGRIDRIDHNERTGECVILDYKTGDDGKSPNETHRPRRGEWADLQLPLYRHLAKSLELPGEPRLGYIVLPKDVKAVREKFAEWSADELKEADSVAIDVAGRIARREFWPPKVLPYGFRTDFDDICQVGVFGVQV